MLGKTTVYLLVLFIVSVNCGLLNFFDIKREEIVGDPGEALFLTPLIDQNKIEEARAASTVNSSDFKNVVSYSGYLTVNNDYNSNLFFWFFPSESNYEEDPVVLWLQGGPGISSFLGLFEENGPFLVNEDGVRLRDYSWTKSHSVIYIDNPVGTGYSFTDDGGYAQTETQIGEELYNALQQFFTLFPELQENEFYVTGESYAGKYVPAVSYTIHKKNSEANLKINLKGLAIGNGLSDPEHQLKYGEYLYQIGLVDSNTRDVIQDYEEKGVQLVQSEEYYKAYEIFDYLMLGDLSNNTCLFKNVTGLQNLYNYLYALNPVNDNVNYMGQYIQKSEVRTAIHVGNSTFSYDDRVVEDNLLNDFMQSVAPWISELLSSYRVLIYSGQLDVILAYPLTLNYLQNLQFDSAEEYKRALRQLWYVDTDLAGYFKQAGNLTEVLVRDSGHMVPTDQPQWAYDLISKFTRNQALN